jgi:hypothetical protein
MDDLQARIGHHNQAMILYELIPPKLGALDELEQNLSLIRELAEKVDGINIPEVREESRQGARPSPLPERIEPRVFAKAIQASTGVETVINRVTVHDAAPEQGKWLRETYDDYAIRNLILVGGESRKISYPGPSVSETAAICRQDGRSRRRFSAMAGRRRSQKRGVVHRASGRTGQSR